MRAHSSRKTARRFPIPVQPKRTILYVGAEPECRTVFSRVVRRFDRVDLVVAENGREGRLLVFALTPRLIVFDAQLPNSDADDFVLYLGRSSLTAVIPLAVVSSNEIQRARFFRAGAAACLTKPLKIAEVERAVVGLLELAAAR